MQLPVQLLLATFAVSLNFNGWSYFSFLSSKLQSSGRRRRWVITLLFFYFIRPSFQPVLLKQLESQLSGLTYWHICIPLWHSYGLFLWSLASILLQVSARNVSEWETNTLESSAGALSTAARREMVITLVACRRTLSSKRWRKSEAAEHGVGIIGWNSSGIPLPNPTVLLSNLTFPVTWLK